jgi:hypothetical protein
MLTEEEKRFLAYWEENRLRKNKVLRQLYVGLPLATILVIAIFANFFSGWYTRAGIALRSQQASLILVLLAAAIAIVVFIVIFSARHRWDRQEQHYRELLERSKNE